MCHQIDIKHVWRGNARQSGVSSSPLTDRLRAVFFSGPKPLHGKQQVVDYWARFYTAPAAPFSWEPREVEVLASGDLALSSGPVRDATGKDIATFTSIWRKEAPNTWKIVFDKGNEVCKCATAPQ